jgi:hypothetical protein
MRIQDSGGAFNDQTMKIVRLNGFAKRFAEPVQEVEDQGFLAPDLFLGSFQAANAT